MLTRVTFTKCNLSYSSWDDLTVTRSTFVGCDFFFASFAGCLFEETNFMNCSYENACFRKISAHRLALTDGDMTSAEFIPEKLMKCVLVNLRLRGEHLRGSNLQECTFNDAELSQLDLRDAQVKYCHFSNARLIHKLSTVRIDWMFF